MQLIKTTIMIMLRWKAMVMAMKTAMKTNE